MVLADRSSAWVSNLDSSTLVEAYEVTREELHPGAQGVLKLVVFRPFFQKFGDCFYIFGAKTMVVKVFFLVLNLCWKIRCPQLIWSQKLKKTVIDGLPVLQVNLKNLQTVLPGLGPSLD